MIFRIWLILLMCLNISLAKDVGPISILDSPVYQVSDDLKTMQRFLGHLMPKYLYLKLSEKDKFLTRRLLIKALEESPSFLDHNWINVDNQHSGIILIYPVEILNDQKCRKFLIRLRVGDEAYRFQGQSCRINGHWDIENQE